MPAKISAIIPAYNRPKLLREAIASAYLQSGHPFDEIIVTDDLGSDENRSVVETLNHEFLGAGDFRSGEAVATMYRPIEYQPNPLHLGGVESWNRGLALAKGDWITLLHEDDILLPNFLEIVRPLLGANIAAVAVRVLNGRSLEQAKQPRFTGQVSCYRPQYFLKSSMTPFPGVVLSRACVASLKGFDSSWGALADYEFWYRVSQYGRIVFVDLPAAFYRTSPDQWTSRAWPEMLRKSLLLRRKIAREQFPEFPRWGKWVARFFTIRNGRAYFRTYAESGQSSATLVRRIRQLQRMPLSWLPSGWVWLSVKLAARWQARAGRVRGNHTNTSDEPLRKLHHA